MSYILEALRKSEQERNPEKVPDLATHHHHVSGQQKSKFPYWILGIVVVLVNGFILFYLFNKDDSPVMQSSQEKRSQGNIEAQNIKEEPKIESVPEQVKDAELETMPASEIVKDPVPEPIVEEKAIEQPAAPIPQTTTILNRESVVDISELTLSLQRQIPDMDFSTHIYVRDGGSFIIINDKNLSEGMSISRGLKVKKILSDGIILEFKAQQFFLASMSNWQQN